MLLEAAVRRGLDRPEDVRTFGADAEPPTDEKLGSVGRRPTNEVVSTTDSAVRQPSGCEARASAAASGRCQGLI